MDSEPAQKAISAALSGNWKEAILLNKLILKSTHTDVDAMNRLARAYAELGDFNGAKRTANKVLKVDPGNKIAARCLSKLKQANKDSGVNFLTFNPDAFLEDPGKTRTISLMHAGADEVLATTDPACEVKLVPHAHRVNVLTVNDKYIGRLPDDLAARIRSLMKNGYQYRTLIKSVDKKEVSIFIREILRPTKYSNVTSFPPEKFDYVSFVPSELAKDGASPTEGAEEF